MKRLRIDSGRGQYILNGEEWRDVGEINRDDLLELVNLALTEDFEIDKFSPDDLKNPAHQIVYKNLAERLVELQDNRDRFRDESESQFKKAIEKYTAQIAAEKARSGGS